MTEEERIAACRDDFDGLFCKPAALVTRAELFTLANNLSWLIGYAERTRPIEVAAKRLVMAQTHMLAFRSPTYDDHEREYIQARRDLVAAIGVTNGMTLVEQGRADEPR